MLSLSSPYFSSEKTEVQRGCQWPKFIWSAGGWGRAETQSSWIQPFLYNTCTVLGLQCAKDGFPLYFSAPLWGCLSRGFLRLPVSPAALREPGPFSTVIRQLLWPALGQASSSSSTALAFLGHWQITRATSLQKDVWRLLSFSEMSSDLSISRLLDSVEYFLCVCGCCQFPYVKSCARVLSRFSRVWLFTTLWTVAR